MATILKPAPFVEAAVESYRHHLAEQVALHGVPDDPPDAVGRRAAVASTAGRAWADDTGPFYDTDGARVALGDVTKQAVSQRVADRRLLGLRLAPDGSGRSRLVYPAWQFRAGILRHLPAVLAAAGFDPDRPVTGWTIAHWLINPSSDGTRPAELVEAGHTAAVLAEAREVAVSLGVDEGQAGNA